MMLFYYTHMRGRFFLLLPRALAFVSHRKSNSFGGIRLRDELELVADWIVHFDLLHDTSNHHHSRVERDRELMMSNVNKWSSSERRGRSVVSCHAIVCGATQLCHISWGTNSRDTRCHPRNGGNLSAINVFKWLWINFEMVVDGERWR